MYIPNHILLPLLCLNCKWNHSVCTLHCLACLAKHCVCEFHQIHVCRHELCCLSTLSCLLCGLQHKAPHNAACITKASNTQHLLTWKSEFYVHKSDILSLLPYSSLDGSHYAQLILMRITQHSEHHGAGLTRAPFTAAFLPWERLFSCRKVLE